MNKKILIIVTLLISTVTFSETKMKNESLNTFSDKIKSIKENEKELVVQFVRHAALYKIEKNNPQYEKLKASAEKYKNDKTKIKVTAIIPKMQIKNLSE